MTLPSTVRHRRLEDPRRATHLMIRPKTCAGLLHSMLPTIDIPEPMQEPVPAFVVGSGLA
jgi:hypothetical protein